MNLFFDTNVLIALTDETHSHHHDAMDRFRRSQNSRLYLAAHSLAEYYAVTTRLPALPALPEQSLLLLERLVDKFSPVTLTAAEYLSTIRHIAEMGLTGGIVYDALLLACARKCKADRIYTFNARHFTRIAPDLAAKIQAP